MDSIGIDFAAKLAAAAAVVLLATLVAERAGPFLGAVIVALPISAGPAYVIVAMEQDAAFVARSAEASLALNAAMGPFLLAAAAILLKTKSIALALTAGMAIWAGGAAFALFVAPPIEVSIPLNMAVFLASAVVAKSMFKAPDGGPARRGLLDVLVRAVGVVTVVGLAILASRELGPRFAGVAALIPVVWICTTVVVKGRSGPGAAAALIANGVVTMNGFWIGLAIVAMTVEPLGEVRGLSLALAACLLTGYGLAVAKRRIERLSSA